MIHPGKYLIDTHALHWHWATPGKLPQKVREIFARANRGEASLIVSHIVLLEIYFLYKKLGCVDQFRDRLVDMSSVDSFQLEPVLLKDIENMPAFEDVPEMHDRILVIQANRLGVAMITKDESIQKSNTVEIIWN
ncbi:MAG: PIN domain-containing protein [Planctomycetota bacterium]